MLRRDAAAVNLNSELQRLRRCVTDAQAQSSTRYLRCVRRHFFRSDDEIYTLYYCQHASVCLSFDIISCAVQSVSESEILDVARIAIASSKSTIT